MRSQKASGSTPEAPICVFWLYPGQITQVVYIFTLRLDPGLIRVQLQVQTLNWTAGSMDQGDFLRRHLHRGLTWQ